MDNRVDIRYGTPKLLDSALTLVGGVGMTAVGAAVLNYVWHLAPPDPSSTSALAFRALLGMAGLAMSAGGPAAAYFGLVAPFVDRSLKLSLTQDRLTDHRARPARDILFEDVREVSLLVTGWKGVGVRTSATILLRLEGAGDDAVEALGLDVEPEAICGMIEERVKAGKADAGPPVECLLCEGSGVMRGDPGGGKGTVSETCFVCGGRGAIPRSSKPPGENMKVFCGACGHLNPFTAASCAKCAAPLPRFDTPR